VRKRLGRALSIVPFRVDGSSTFQQLDTVIPDIPPPPSGRIIDASRKTVEMADGQLVARASV
jgi:hypothetical protein